MPNWGITQLVVETVKHFGQAEGLNIPHVMRIYEDKSGALWLFTFNRDGFGYGVGNIWEVVQFDGKEFINPEGWFSDSLYSVDMGQFNDNQLIIKYNRNIFDILDTESRTTQRVSMEEHFPAYDYHFGEWISNNDIGFIHSGGGRTWLSLWDGQLDTLCSVPSQKVNNWQAGIIRNEDEIWWSAAGAGFFKYNQTTGFIKQYMKDDIKGLKYSPTDTMGLFFEIAYKTPQGNLIFGLRHCIPAFYQYNPTQDNFEPLLGQPLDLECNFAYRDDAGRLLLVFGSYYFSKAIWLMDLDGSVYDYSEILSGLTDHRVNWYQSRNFKEYLWAAHSNGLTFLEFKNPAQHLKNLQTYSSFRGALELAPGKILFATDNDGWFLWEDDGETLSPYPFSSKIIRQLPPFCRGMYLNEDGSLWATNAEYILKIDTTAKSSESYEAPFLIQSMARLNNGHFLIAGEGSSELIEFSPIQKTFKPYLADLEENPLQNKFCHSIYEASNGIVWVGTSGGLVKFDKLNQATKTYTTKEGLGNNTVMDIHEEPDGKLWLATAHAGISIFDPESESFSYLQKKDGLVDNTVAGILKDSEGDFWFMTFNGLSCYKPATETFLNFSTADGFSHHEFNRFAFEQLSDGRFCLGTIQGMNVFDPLALKRKKGIPQLILQEAEYFDIEQKESVTRYHNLSELKEITLPPFDRYLRLRFRLSDLINAEKHQFAAYLEGYDKDWNDFNFRNEVIFNNLPAGDYILHLRGINESGLHNSNPINIQIEVEEYFYKKGWFLALCLLIFMAALYALYRYRLHQVYKMMELRTKIASDLHDDVGGLLTGIAMQSEILELSKAAPDKNKLRKIRDLSKDAISRMRDVVWSIDARRDKMSDLLDRMRDHAEETLRPKGLAYKVEVKNLKEDKILPVAVRQNLYLIFKEAITNTVRHAEATKVTILLENAHIFRMIIKDNGKGLQQKGKFSGLGLDNIRMRAEQMEGEVEFRNMDGFEIVVRRNKL